MRRTRAKWLPILLIVIPLAFVLPAGWEVARRARAAMSDAYSTSRPQLDWGLSTADLQQWRTFAGAHLKRYAAAFTGNPADFAMRRDPLRFDDLLFHFEPGSWKLNESSQRVTECRPIAAAAIRPIFSSAQLELIPSNGKVDVAIVPNVRGCPFDTLDWWPPRPRDGRLNAYLLDSRPEVSTGLLLVDPENGEAWLFAFNLD